MNQRTFQRLDRLNTRLAQLLLELRFAVSLIEQKPPHSLQIDGESMLAVMARITRELETPHGLVQREIRAKRRR